jgi:hypothetical protein
VKKQTELESESHSPLWKGTPVSNLVRYESSGIYFARGRIGGKLIRQYLKTEVSSVAHLRLGGLIKKEREKLEARATSALSRMTFGDATESYRQRLEVNPALKPSANLYRRK